MTNKELEAKIKEIEKLVKFHDKQIDGLLEAVGYINDILPAKSKPEHHDFKVGDRVQFKSWDEMEKEFGLDMYGNISSIAFDKKMKHLCGTYATIETIYNDNFFNVELQDFSTKGSVDWGFTLKMLKPAKDEPKQDDKKSLLSKLEKCWNKNPDLRFGQLISNITENKDCFYTSNSDFENMIDNYNNKEVDEPKCKFKVGDRVKVNSVNDGDDILNNQIATICKICPDNVPPSYLVDFDDKKIGMVWVNEQILEPYTEPRWTFTDDEKVILRNLPDEYKWIARDKNNRLSIHFEKPIRYKNSWNGGGLLIDEFNHLFQSIKWADTEPCEFRKYI